MHKWGDKDFNYWKEVDEAAEYIADFCVILGRINVRDWKEKFGTVRVYCRFGLESLGSLIWPRIQYYGDMPNYFKVLWGIYIPNFINSIIVPYQLYIYRKAYKNAIKKWPMIKEEILCAADWSEYLKGI